MDKLLLVSHGNFAKELKKSTEMIIGENKNIITLGLDDQGIEKFEKKFVETIEKIFKQQESITILCDIKGGTPFNVAYKYLLEKKKNIKIITGMNLPMLVDMMLQCDINDFKNTVENSKNSIDIVSL